MVNLKRCSLLGAVLFAALPVAAQEIFPSHPIQMVVPQAPGGAADLHARPLALGLERILRQPVIVMNKPGATGVVGTQFVANSRADGYTLLVVMPGFLITPQVDSFLGNAPKYKFEQFTPIARLSAEPLVIVASPSRQWKSVADFVADAKRRPGDIAYGSSGLYRSIYLQMELLPSMTGISLKHVPYNGVAPAVTALLGGHVDALASGPGPILKKIETGALRALAMSGNKRLPALPEVPTLKELGLDIEFYQQVGLIARRETPPSALKVLRDAARQALHDPEFGAAMNNLGTAVSYVEAGDYEALWATESKAIAGLLQRIGKRIK
ncbi:MAG: tripartite tricarboxylate transporter substrate binding protein [Betaproteobacteria bacterium]|nr:tripartite tricarboxylate transporter substrate binding protein [Betaproteobacteria bacterium]